MCNHLNLKILIHIFTIIFLIKIIIVMRGENFVAHLDGLGGTPVAHYWFRGPLTPSPYCDCFQSFSMQIH
jgi:hypothetical protein